MAMLQQSSISSSSSTFFRSFLSSGLLSKGAAPKSLNIYTNSQPLAKPYRACKASWQELVGVLIFSAVPFTAVKAIANSPLGELLQSLWYGEKRPRWLGPISYDYPSYLTGELPGDYGFDIAGLSRDPVAFQKYFKQFMDMNADFLTLKFEQWHRVCSADLVCFEILHARWAMLAALGALIPELLDLVGAFHFVEPVWWKVGYSKLKGDTLDYLGIPGLHLAGSQGVIVIAICQALLMVGPEYARYCGIEALEPLGIYLPGDINYPGGALFDPLNLSKDPVSFEDLKVKEIKNGRLAMIAWLGFYTQAALTGKGPVQNLLDHILDPFHNNLLSILKFM
ncbi:unnamed protein product [Camellia sinensis]